ncbi:MAG TPA: acyl-CoA desaturase, partial [Micromonosporaceae bacterium]|nr:acyl-CoA desaturase [Micromonosporaceae bacterium]
MTSTLVKPLHGGERSIASQLGMYVFIVGPFLALLAAVPLTWGWGVGWVDLVLAAAFYVVTCLGVTVGFHRYFTHRAFKAKRGVRIALAIAGSMALQGPILHWVADHR